MAICTTTPDHTAHVAPAWRNRALVGEFRISAMGDEASVLRNSAISADVHPRLWMIGMSLRADVSTVSDNPPDDRSPIGVAVHSSGVITHSAHAHWDRYNDGAVDDSSTAALHAWHSVNRQLTASRYS
jgi:hypothetical protein